MDFWTQLAKLSFLESDRLYLRPVTYADASAFFEIVSDAQELSFIFPAVATKFESDYLLTHAFLKNPLGCWVICLKNQDQMIGFIKFENVTLSDGKSELGYFLRSDYRGKGYMTEAVRLVASRAMSQLGLESLYIVTHRENLASQAVAKATSFVFKKSFKGSDRYTHKMREYCEYQITKGDYHE